MWRHQRKHGQNETTLWAPVKDGKMRVFAVSGYSGTGKTALVEAIVKSLVSRGYSVATVKSSKHPAGPEQGTDTWRHMQAGASMTVFIGPSDELISLRNRLKPDELDELSKHDFLIIEGMKSADIPRFWCIGDEDLEHEDIPRSTEAIVSWSDRQVIPSLDLPFYMSNEVDRLVEIVKRRSVDFREIE